MKSKKRHTPHPRSEIKVKSVDKPHSSAVIRRYKLDDELKRRIMEVYSLLVRANHFLEGLAHLPLGDARTEARNYAVQGESEVKEILVKTMETC